MRPDKAHLILLPANFAWRGIAVDVAVPVGERPRTKALEWLKTYVARTGRLLFYHMSEDWYAFGPPAFPAEMRARIDKGEQLWA